MRVETGSHFEVQATETRARLTLFRECRDADRRRTNVTTAVVFIAFALILRLASSWGIKWRLAAPGTTTVTTWSVFSAEWKVVTVKGDNKN